MKIRPNWNEQTPKTFKRETWHFGVETVYGEMTPKEKEILELKSFPSVTGFRVDPDFYMNGVFNDPNTIIGFLEAKAILRYAMALKGRSPKKLAAYADKLYSLISHITQYPDDVLAPQLQFALHVWPLSLKQIKKSEYLKNYVITLMDNYPQYNLEERLRSVTDPINELRLLKQNVVSNRNKANKQADEAVAKLYDLLSQINDILSPLAEIIEENTNLIKTHNDLLPAYNKKAKDTEKIRELEIAHYNPVKARKLLLNFSHLLKEYELWGLPEDVSVKKVNKTVKEIIKLKNPKKEYTL